MKQRLERRGKSCQVVLHIALVRCRVSEGVPLEVSFGQAQIGATVGRLRAQSVSVLAVSSVRVRLATVVDIRPHRRLSTACSDAVMSKSGRWIRGKEDRDVMQGRSGGGMG